ncbi:hypothetical protein EIP91_003755 [Steccherinum ochraceum]|uniref:F-box domain-containing protein n=1 Tax=Steccherinum ochraceum TaxID=92696 RepID=A0A4R0RBF2_9APHY|nr:hypothetical protein EIP91_003755 [Steccherinum ochraceum]
MHRLFRIQELVDNIAQCLAVRDSFSTDPRDTHYRIHPLSTNVKKDVKNLGQAGRVFRRSCLNELWYHQDGIVQLLFMVSAVDFVAPAHPYRRSADRYNTGTRPQFPRPQWTLIRSLQSKDIPAILFYSSRIRQLSFTSTARLVRLGQLLPPEVPLLSGSILFPQLRVLTWMFNNGAAWNLDFVLDRTGGSLTEMAGAISADQRPRFMATIKERRGQLSHISFQDWQCEQFTSKATGHFFRDVLRDAKDLRELHLDADFQRYLNVWDVIPQMPCLSMLSLVNTAAPVSPASYPTLTAVTINNDDVHSLSPILNNVSFPSLRELKIGFTEHFHMVVVPAVHTLFSSIASACANAPLTSLTISSDYSNIFDGVVRYIADAPDAGTIPQCLRLDDLRQLMKQFRKLEVLDLSLQCYWVLGDSGIEEIGRIWGDNLKTLRLDPKRLWSASTECITLQGLEHFAMFCPRLSTLGVHFVDNPPVRTIPSVHMRLDRSWNRASRLSYVGSTPLDPFTVKDMARYLMGLFPRLGVVEPEGTESEMWGSV